MKIFCIARNYSEHVREMNNRMPDDPVIFLKPESALLRDNEPFVIPSFSKMLHYETELVVKICNNGKNISMENAHQFYNEITVGIDFTARDLQNNCRQKGLPWEISKAFDGSAAAGKFIQISSLSDREKIIFHLCINGKAVQNGNSGDMIYPIPDVIAYVSTFFALNKGDLIFTGTPAGVGVVNSCDLLEGFLNEEKLLSLTILKTS